MAKTDDNHPPEEGAAKAGAKVVPIGSRVGRAGSRRPANPDAAAEETDTDDPDPGPSAA